MTIATHHIYRSLGSPIMDVPEQDAAPCCLCGYPDARYPARAFIKAGFTNLDRLQAPESSTICAACATCLANPQLRSKSWIALPGKLELMVRNDIWRWLFNLKDRLSPFAFYVTTSHKKHGSFKTRLNHSWGEFFVQFEETPVTFNALEWNAPGRIIERLYSIPRSEEEKKQARSFFTKEMIRTGQYAQHRILQFGFERWQEAESVLAPLRSNPAFGLLVHAVNQQKLGLEEVQSAKSTTEQNRRSDLDAAQQCLWGD